MVRLSLWLWLCMAWLGCFNDQVAADDLIACSDDQDCPSGWLCVAAQCRQQTLPAPPNLEVSTNEDVAVNIDLFAVPTLSGLVVTLVQPPAAGVVATLENEVVNGVARYQPSTNAAVRDSFSYRWTINGVDAGTGTVIITIIPRNDAPEIVILLDSNGTLTPTTTLIVDEGTAKPFFVRATDAEGVDGRLPPGDGNGTYRVEVAAAGPCQFGVVNVIADVWEVRAPDDDVCPLTGLSSSLQLVATDSEGVAVTVAMPMVRQAINDVPSEAIVEVICLGELTPLGACRGGASLTASASDRDGDVLCASFTATNELDQTQPIVGEPCASSAILQPNAGSSVIEVVARLCDPSNACTEARVQTTFVATSRDCATLKNANPALPTGTYVIDPLGDGVGFEAFCNMTFNQGGYALALKIDGRSSLFRYGDLGDNAWTSSTFDATDIDESAAQVKLQPYLSVPLTEVVMVVDDQLSQPTLNFDRAVVVDAFAATSLQQLVTGPSQFVEGDFRPWRLFPSTSFQCGCNRVVINTAGLRLGLLVDEDINQDGTPTAPCNDPDSFVGIGGNCFGGPGAAGNCSAVNSFDSCDQQPDDGFEGWRPWFSWIYVRSTNFSDQPAAASCAAHEESGSTIPGRYRLSDGSTATCTFSST